MKVFFLHGMGGGPEDWAKVSAHLPGTALRVPSGKSWGETVDLIRSNLEGEIENFLLAGYSMGGRLGVAVARGLKNPRFRGLALVSSGLGFSSEEERAQRRGADQAWSQQLRGSPVEFWQSWYEQPLFQSFSALPPALKSTWLEARLALDPADVVHQLLVLSPAAHESLLPDLKALRVPVLFLAGERDGKYRALAEMVSGQGIRTQLLPGGHILPLEAPRELARALANFVRETESEKENGKKYGP